MMIRFLLVACLAAIGAPAAAQKLDATPRTVVMTAFPPEWDALIRSVARKTPDGWLPPEPVDAEAPAHWDMMFPRGVRVGSATEPWQRRYLLAADPALLD